MPDKDKAGQQQQPQQQLPPPQPSADETADSRTSTPRPSSAKKKHLSPKEVHEIIKQGYDTLSIQAAEELSTWERWREGDWRSELKRTSRIAVEDAKVWIARRNGEKEVKEGQGQGQGVGDAANSNGAANSK